LKQTGCDIAAINVLLEWTLFPDEIKPLTANVLFLSWKNYVMFVTLSGSSLSVLHCTKAII
jgi:hypothetical protein